MARPLVWLIAVLALAFGSAGHAQLNPSIQDANPAGAAPAGGPIRLRQGGIPAAPAQDANAPQRGITERAAPPKYRPGEFELFVQRRAGQDALTEPELQIRRFGAELVTGSAEGADLTPLVPPDYLVKPGDELALTIWGSADADLRLLVDRSGRVAIPRVGTVLVAGVRYADLPGVITQRVAQVFRNFQLSVSLGQLRAQRVYVTGFVARPGTYTVSSLA
ncbi:MAG: polysaccharide biosynthesis/export family protein, partial [Aquincola sp.]|nr:polysaccharide biosynthesis/export family protein [Aquincola sp.]